MMYETLDPQLLRFLLDPLANLEKMRQTRAKPSRISRLLYRVPWLRHLISPEQVGFMLLEKVLGGLEQAREALPVTLFEEHAALDETTLPLYLGALGKYFCIQHPGVEDQPLSEPQAEMLEAYRERQLFTKFEYTNNRISENLQLQAEHNLAIVSNAQLWLSYFLVEACFLIGQGLMQAQLRGSTLYITPTEVMARQLKAYWLAETSEESTKLSDMNMMWMALDAFQKHGRLPEPLQALMIKTLMDKCLSLHSEYVSPELQANPQFQLLQELTCFALYLELCAMLGQTAVPVAQMQCYVSPATLALIDGQLQDRLPTLDCASSFVQRRGDLYHRGPVKLKYGLKQLVKAVLDKGFSGKLGEFFEGDYLMQYIRERADSRFVLHEGFKAEKNAQVDGYDIDFVLQDVEDDLYYFVQVKYKSFDLPTYFAEQCRLMSDANFRKGFDKQLQLLRRNIEAPSIRQKLERLGLERARAGNSHFILLHNLPFLNFHELEGVYFYEWNLFRNLLQNGRVQYVKGREVRERRLLDKPRFHRPDELVDAYFEQGEHAEEMQLAFYLFRNTFARFRYDGLEVFCKTL